MEMSSAARFSYQKLKGEVLFDEFEERKRVRRRSWFRFRKVRIKRRFRLRIPSLRRFFKKKARLVRLSCAKVLQRFKEGQGHFGDLFAGNYLFLQISPASLKKFEKPCHGAVPIGALDGFSSAYSLQTITK